MDRNFFATDRQYYLMELMEEDRNNYLHLLKQSNELEHFVVSRECEELIWNMAFKNNLMNYSIYDLNKTYCGNLVVKYTDSRTPELGMDLLPEQRNKGIAGKCIRMLVAKMYETRKDIDYFILRVSSCNYHSKHMIEKLGATLIGEEDTQAVKMLKEGIDYAKRNSNVSLLEKYQKMLVELHGSVKERILIYRL